MGFIERSYESEIEGLKAQVKSLTDAAASCVVTRAKLADDLAVARKQLVHADRMAREVKCMYRNAGNTEALRLAAHGYDAERKGVEIGERRPTNHQTQSNEPDA